MTVRFYKEKAYFSTSISGQNVMARAACIILRYKDSESLTGEKFVLTIKERADKNVVEFPGGKVEVGDLDLYDTTFREVWEEIFLKDILGEGNHKHLRNWAEIRDTITHSNDPDMVLCHQIYKSLINGPMMTYGRCALKTIYFIVDVTADQAKYLMNTHRLVPLSVNVISHIVDFNNTKKKTFTSSQGYKRRSTFFHSDGELYKIRGRDFEGIFRVSDRLLRS